LDLRSGDLGGQIVRFARNLLELAIPDGLDTGDQLAYCWRTWPVGEVLLVYDNAGEYGELQSFLPPADPRYRVLITSRNRMGSPVETLEILVLEEDACLELLGVLEGKGRVQNQIGDAKELCRRLGYLPLAIELVGRYLAKKPDLSLSTMLGRLAEKGLSAKALALAEVGMTAKLGVAAAFDLSWQELDGHGQELGCLLSLFAEAPIPWKFVEECLSQWESEDLEDLRDEQLCGLSLLERREEGDYQLHPLIWEYFGHKQVHFDGVEELKRGYCRVMVSQAKSFPLIPTRMQWEGFAPVVPHLAEVADRLLDWVEDEDLRWLFVGLGRFYDGQGAYGKAEPWYLKCLEACEKRFGQDHQYVATSLSNLAELYQSQGRFKEAEPLYIQSLELHQKLDEESLNVANSLNNISSFYFAQGHYEQAEPPSLRALEMRRKFGAVDLSIAESLHNLAAIYQSQCRYKEAEQHFLQVQDIYKESFSDDESSQVATLLNNMAGMYLNQKRYAEAEPLLVRALKITIKLFGKEHLSLATPLTNMAGMYLNQKRYVEAEPLYLQALELRGKFLGKEHPSVATSLTNLALLYFHQRRYFEAKALYAQAVSIGMNP
jgi:tetratricopeptide (TPR) repeat protein